MSAPLRAARLDDDRGVGQAADEPVAAREGAARGLRVGCELAHDGTAARDDALGEPLVDRG